MNRDLSQGLRVGIPILAVGAVLIGLVAVLDDDPSPADRGTQRIGASGVSLVAYDTCESALTELRGAALPLVGPYGLAGETVSVADSDGGPIPPGAPVNAAPEAGAAAPRADAGAAKDKQAEPAAPGHSTTNTHEAGVDEPDLVKTDGQRLITIADGRLRVIDVASRRLTATLDLPGGPASQLLTSGDRALVVTGAGSGPIVDRGGKPAPAGESRLVLVDLTGAGRVLGSLAVDGGYLDARQTGAVARVVLRSVPRLEFVYPDGTRSEGEALRQNRSIVEHA
ncbi:beta-propeller domain-containing protein, partial [Actinophytocola sp.]|uniref:beta-propeller domain-containing protein n=1 Tax=Actinophytocola sp. TaxID=1872138 RepID=UPI002D7FAEEB